MAIHDAYARFTPYELFVPDGDFVEERFAAVAAEAEERGVSLSDPERFVMLMAAGDALQELRGPEDDSARIRQHGLLLFHAWHFHDAGEPLWLLTTPAARWVVEGAAAGEAGGGGGEGGARSADRIPSEAGYLQLPQHLFWARVGEAEAVGEEPRPRSLDGAFWVAEEGRIHVLGVLGVREDRPGFDVVPLSSLPADEIDAWAAASMREGGDDFRSEMPGAEIEGLYEIRTAGELLKLLARAFAVAPPRDEAEVEQGPEPGEVPPERPRPSVLPFRRILLTRPT